jgi:hypothetical protein
MPTCAGELMASAVIPIRLSNDFFMFLWIFEGSILLDWLVMPHGGMA